MSTSYLKYIVYINRTVFVEWNNTIESYQLCSSLFILFLLMTLCDARSHCPPGFIENKSSKTHQVFSAAVVVRIWMEISTVTTSHQYCMSFHSVTNYTVVGRCPFNCNYTLTKTIDSCPLCQTPKGKSLPQALSLWAQKP